jgi:hypothetical protein
MVHKFPPTVSLSEVVLGLLDRCARRGSGIVTNEVICFLIMAFDSAKLDFAANFTIHALFTSKECVERSDLKSSLDYFLMR